MASWIDLLPADIRAEVLAIQADARRLQGEVTTLESQINQLRAQAGALIADPSSAIEWITLESKWTEPIRVNDPLRQRTGPPGPGDAIAAHVQPYLQIKFRPVTQPVAIGPWGRPRGNNAGLVALGAGALAGVLAMGMARKILVALPVGAAAAFLVAKSTGVLK